MLVVIDANKLYSCLLSKGNIFKVLSLNSLSKKIEFIAPEFILVELGKHLDDISKKSKLDEEELSELFSFIKEQINTIPFENFNEFAEEAKKLAPHDKDIQYFSLALASNCGIWSDEKLFWTQPKIEIISTGKLLKFLGE